MPANLTENVSGTPDATSESDGYSSFSEAFKSFGIGYAIWPEVRGEYLFGQFGLGASVGYLLNTGTTMKYTSVPSGLGSGPDVPADGGTVETPNYSTGDYTPWALSTSGFSFSIYGVWHFRPLF
jgi:hypothetical protein